MHGLWNLIGKVGQSSTQAFPYEIGDKIVGHEGRTIWTLHCGKKKVRHCKISLKHVEQIRYRKSCFI